MATAGNLDCVVPSLKDLLRDWTDWDVAAHAVGVVLGVFPASSKMSDFKGMFWSRNDQGRHLDCILDALLCQGFLERNDHEDGNTRYRWNPAR